MRDVVVFLDSTPTGSGGLFFERARNLGLVPVLVSANPSRHKYLAQYESIQVAEMTLNGVLGAIDQLGRERVAGVWSSLTIRAELAARAARAIGRPHSDPDAVAICCDKYLTRKVLADAGIRDVAYELVHTGAEAEKAAERLGQTVIVKPRLSSGAVGVRICGSKAEARSHVNALLAGLKGQRDQGVVLEEYVEGTQYGVEIFDSKSLGVRRKHISPPPASIPIGHDFPTMDDPEICAKIADHAQRATAAAGYVRGPAHVELRYGRNGPCLIEINPRVAGALGPVNVHLATGVDLIKDAIRFACGLPYDLSPGVQRASCVRHLLRDGPSVMEVVGREAALGAPGVAEVGIFPDWFYRRGPARDFEDRIAYVISVAETPAEAIRCADEGLRKLKIVPEPAWQHAWRRVVQKISKKYRR